MLTKRNKDAATIANGASLSGEVVIPDGLAPVGIIMPGTWTTATLSFEVSYDGTTFSPLFDGSGEINPAAAASRYISLDPTKFRGVSRMKVRSGTSASAVAQGADRVLTVVFAKAGAF